MRKVYQCFAWFFWLYEIVLSSNITYGKLVNDKYVPETSRSFSGCNTNGFSCAVDVWSNAWSGPAIKSPLESAWVDGNNWLAEGQLAPQHLTGTSNGDGILLF